MSYRIEYTHRAINELDDIIQYVIDHFGFKAAEKVKSDFSQIIQQIAINPFQFPYFNKRRGIRKCVMSPQTTLYYRFNKNVVNLLSFRGNFLNPRSRNL
jgi:plasmid stabilization system protein ParE